MIRYEYIYIYIKTLRTALSNQENDQQLDLYKKKNRLHLELNQLSCEHRSHTKANINFDDKWSPDEMTGKGRAKIIILKLLFCCDVLLISHVLRHIYRSRFFPTPVMPFFSLKFDGLEEVEIGPGITPWQGVKINGHSKIYAKNEHIVVLTATVFVWEMLSIDTCN